MVKSNESELERIEEDKENANKIGKGEKSSTNSINEQGQAAEKGTPTSNNDEEQDHGKLLLFFKLFSPG